MKKQFKQEGLVNCLVFDVAEEILESYPVNMLQNNKLRHILPLTCHCMDGAFSLSYAIQGKQSLAFVLEQMELDFIRLKTMLECIVAATEEVRDYLLDERQILLHTEDIFVNISDFCLCFCYVPDSAIKTMEEQLKGFVETVMQYVNHKEQQAVLFIYGLYGMMVEKPFGVEDLKAYLKTYEKGNAVFQVEEDKSAEGEPMEEPDKKDITGQQETGLEDRIPVKETVCKENHIFMGLRAVFRIVREKISGEKVVEQHLNAWKEERAFGQEREGDTRTLAFENQVKQEALYPLERGEQSAILVETDKPVVIGRMEEGCDYIIRQPEISRFHAKLMIKKGTLFVMDLNSTNGTFINGVRIPGNEEIALKKGSCIAFGKVRFLVI